MLNKAHFLDIKKCAFKSDLSGRDFKWYGTITHSHKYTCKTGSFLILYKTLSLIMFSLFSNRSKDRHKNTSEVTFWHKLNCRRTDGCPWELFVKESIFKIKKKNHRHILTNRNSPLHFYRFLFEPKQTCHRSEPKLLWNWIPRPNPELRVVSA